MTYVYIILSVVAIVAVLVVVLGLRMDREYQRGVIFRLGRFHSVRGPGLYWVIPLVDQKIRVDIRTRTVDIEAQETVTSDSVTIRVNAVLYYRITEPERAVIAVADYEAATYQIALTTLRNVIGQHFLDEVLKDRNKINKAVRPVVDDVTDPWGLSVERVEIKDVEIPGAMQRHGQRGGGGPGEACSIDQSRSGTRSFDEARTGGAGDRRQPGCA